VVNARLDAEMIAQLDELAGEMQRTRSFLIGQAVRGFAEREGEADVESGRTLKGVEDLKARKTSEPPERTAPKRRRA